MYWSADDDQWPAAGDFGFVWGDDSSWKVQYLDPSAVQDRAERRPGRPARPAGWPRSSPRDTAVTQAAGAGVRFPLPGKFCSARKISVSRARGISA